jgi:NAD+ diphosphatase
MKFVGIRSLLGGFDEDILGVISRAFQIIHWERTHLFCGRCGAANMPKEDERAKVCPACGLVIYPELSPAIIVAISKGRELLLAHARRWLSTPFYSVLAGFVEPGETFEQAVMREVMEEVGIEIRDIRYFGSQPWPFPNSIMVGFTAEYESGELRVDENELTDAGWFTSDKLPNLPRKGSIAGRLIQDFVDRVA